MPDDMPEFQMPDRCADCAFRAGTNPRSTPLQTEKAMLCVETGTMFMCHEQAGLGSPEVVCKGFIDAFKAKMESGYYDRQSKWRREMYLAMLDAIDKAEHGAEVDLLQMIRDLPPAQQEHSGEPGEARRIA